MKTAFVILALAAAVSGQRYVDSKQAAILQEARFLSGDGSFGAAYVQEDGVSFKEETDSDGNRKGQYSYVDPNGKTITVAYTAGKNGFQVSGDHLPKAPVPVQAAAPRAPVQQYQAQPAPYNGQEDGQYRPDLYETPYQYQDTLHTTNYNNQPRQQAAQPQQNLGFQNYHHSVNQPAPQQAPVAYTTTTTPSPSRFFPPGKLNLNRTPDGFQYTFQSN